MMDMLYRLFPRGYRRWVGGMIELADIRTTSERYINKAVVISLVLGLLVAYLINIYQIIIFILVFTGIFLLFNGWLVMAIERKRNFVENVLPDALELTAANMRAGFMPSKALLLSARKEFGPLAKAIKKSGKDIMTGKSFSESLSEIPKCIKSEVLDRTVKLIIEGSRSGGQLVALLEENAENIRRRQAVQKEIRANILMYGIFIIFAACVGAPILYSLSGYLITTLTKFGSSVTMPESFSGASFLSMGSVQISPEFLFAFSLVSIIITTFFSGLIISIINTGKERSGIKYIPIFMGIALVVFFVSKMLIESMFYTFMPG